MSKLFLVGHTGSINRGCEAIIRSTIKLFNTADIYDICVASDNITDDKKVNLDRYCKIVPYKNGFSIRKVITKGVEKTFKLKEPNEYLRQSVIFNKVKKGDIVLIVGGDTYCYGRPVGNYVAHEMAKKKGAKTVFWGCSVEEDLITEEMLKDLKMYDLICVREKLSYDTLLKVGISSDKVMKISDPAFHLDTEYTKYPAVLDNNKTVGINISPIIHRNEAAKKAVIELIRSVLNNYDYNILLIPHVYSKNTVDLEVLNDIYSQFDDERINIISDCLSCTQLKYIISKCRFFIGARTHSTIAAYSTGVPTLVLGYSVKSKGIATDLFGTYDKYVVMHNNMYGEVLIDCFKNLTENEIELREKLKNKLIDYKKLTTDAVKAIKQMGNWTDNRTMYIDEKNCSGCGACVAVCPKDCIKMVKNKEGFLYPVINRELCVNCGQCTKVCHYKTKLPDKKVDKIFGAYNKDETVRKNSSSGGVFYALAKAILDQNGVVFGAGFDKDFNVIHKHIEEESGLLELMGSKYVQSVIGDSYIKAREFLTQGRKVLFAGTPCQIKGLITYLGKDYENLVTMDFICHGVPSPLMWRKYLDEKKQEYKSEIKNVSFRDKEYGWKNFSMKIEFENVAIYIKKLTEDSYIRHFLIDISLRNSCYSCNAKGFERFADITVADFWGVTKVKENLTDDKGVSIVITRGNKANEIFGLISNDFNIFETDMETVEKFNPSVKKSVGKNPQRESFFKMTEKCGFNAAYKKCCSLSFGAKLRRKLAKYYRRFL